MFNLEFLISLLNMYAKLGAFVYVLLPMLESLFPMLPLIAIVVFQVTVLGVIKGFLYSWIGTYLGSLIVFLFTRNFIKPYTKQNKILSKVDSFTLFFLTVLAFTPSFFINITYGLSNFCVKKFIMITFFSKGIMILSLVFFGKSLKEAMNHPIYFIFALIIIIIIFLISYKLKKRNHKFL